MSTQWIRRHGLEARRLSATSTRRAAPFATRSTLDAHRRAARFRRRGRDVHIAATTRIAIQAWGFDAHGRKQYRYHERAVERRELRKYYRVRAAREGAARASARAHATPRSRARARRSTPTRVAATVLRLISETFCRIGGERYAKENGTFGITTLRKRTSTSPTAARRSPTTAREVDRSSDRSSPIASSCGSSRASCDTPGARLFRYTRRQAVARSHRARRERLPAASGSASATARRIFARGAARCAPRPCSPSSGRRESETRGEAERRARDAARVVRARQHADDLPRSRTCIRSSSRATRRRRDDPAAVALSRDRRARYAHSPEERALIRFLDGTSPSAGAERARMSEWRRRPTRFP